MTILKFTLAIIGISLVAASRISYSSRFQKDDSIDKLNNNEQIMKYAGYASCVIAVILASFFN